MGVLCCATARWPTPPRNTSPRPRVRCRAGLTIDQTLLSQDEVSFPAHVNAEPCLFDIQVKRWRLQGKVRVRRVDVEAPRLLAQREPIVVGHGQDNAYRGRRVEVDLRALMEDQSNIGHARRVSPV